MIPAGGTGTRFGSLTPKQYLYLAGKPVIAHVIDRMLKIDCLSALVVALNREDDLFHDLPYDDEPFLFTAIAGKTRAESVRSCLFKIYELGGKDSDWVIVHDSVRPVISKIECDRLIEAISHPKCPGAVLAVPVSDTLKEETCRCGAKYNSIKKTISRNGVWHAITPQAFRLGLLLRAIKSALECGIPVTDESNAMELSGSSPWIVRGLRQNLKLTFPEDAFLIEQLLNKFSS